VEKIGDDRLSAQEMKRRNQSWLSGMAGIAVCAALLLCLRPVQAQDVDGPDQTVAAKLRVIHTRHYDIHTDLEPALVAELAERMDVMYDQYVSAMSEFKPAADAPALPVYLFNQRARYMAFTHYIGRNTGGMFFASDHPFLASFLEGQGRDELRRTLQHEAFHQFAYFAISKDIPIWLNEGLAQLFEEGIWTGKSFILGQIPPRRIRQLQVDVQNHTLVQFATFFAISPQEWFQNLNQNADRGATYYNEAWAIAYFLGEGESPDYHDRFVTFMKHLHNGEDSGLAFRQSFPDVQAFQNSFDYWAQGMKATPEATMLERQDILGDLYVALAPTGREAHDMAAFRNKITGGGYTLQYTRGNVKWTTSDNPQIYFSDFSGRLYPPADLFFQSVPQSPAPDIVCLAAPQLELRTHFYRGQDKIEHETIIEPTGQ
jgi:hypothetical protein